MTSPSAVRWTHRAIDVGGRSLQVAIAGVGSPAVVFEHGLGTSMESWGRVPIALAAAARVVMYDRAGRGKSDPAPRPRTARDIVNDLGAALAGAGVAPPYVLVGHSFGGLTVRLYASRHPHEVAGIVLVDGTNELQYARLLALAPPHERDEWRRRYRGGNPEGIDLEASAAELRAAGPLPAVPLVVLTAGRPLEPMPDSAMDPAQVQAVRQELQRELTTRVANGRQIVAARSGHFIQRDEPDLVVDAISAVLDEARADARRPGR